LLIPKTAISTVLNNPHRRQAPPKAHSSLPAVPPADLPRVRRKDFDSYLRAISPEWDRFEKNNHLGREGVPQIGEPSTPQASLPPEPVTPPFSAGKPLPNLNIVPPIFFEPTFDLGDPRTFSAVTEQIHEDDETSDPSSLSHSLPLLEKFSHYADTVEQHLVREISLRSTSFFAALTNLHELQSESEQCLDRISKLRGLLRDVDEKSAKRGLQVVRKESKLRNLEAVREGAKVVNGVVDMTGVAKGLVSAGQWGEALGVIEGLEGLWTAETTPRAPGSIKTHLSPPLSRERDGQLPSSSSPSESSDAQSRLRGPLSSVPLSSLRAFASLPAHLRTLTMEIASSLSSEMVNILRVDLVDRMSSESPSPTSDKQLDINQSLKDRLRPLLYGLVRTRGMREATLSWREVVMGEVQRVIKRVRPLHLWE
jgi:vacuolar protein sorting-associated protein 54